MMKKSALQIARASYSPKLPLGLQGNVSVKEGAPTQSVADQEEVKKLFPNTYGLPLVEFVPGEEKTFAPMNVGVILSGGQAPGGHNVILTESNALTPQTSCMVFCLALVVLLTINIWNLPLTLLMNTAIQADLT